MDTNQLIMTLITVFLLLGLYYLVTFQRRKQAKEIKKMQENLKKGDKVITYTGLSGIIEEVLEDRIILKTYPDDVKLSIEKWAVAGIDDRTIENKKIKEVK